MHPIPILAALVPVAAAGLTFLAAWFGGIWIWVALGWIMASSLLRGPVENAPSNWYLPETLGILHFAVLYVGVTFASIPALLPCALFLAQVSNPVAHELIHARSRLHRHLGGLIFTSMLFGHHVSAHRLVHHTHVATARDPNTARRGESLYRFLPRAWFGSFRAGLRAERRRGHAWVYAGYLAGAAGFLGLSLALAGWTGLLTHVALASYATAMLLTSDYLQHYGLTRSIGSDGRPELVGPQHSWDAPAGLADLLMLNAPRHADHHLHPMLPHSKLSRHPSALRLPYPLAVMAWIAMVPSLWFRLMDRRLDQTRS